MLSVHGDKEAKEIEWRGKRRPVISTNSTLFSEGRPRAMHRNVEHSGYVTLSQRKCHLRLNAECFRAKEDTRDTIYMPRLALNQSVLEESLQKRGWSEPCQFLWSPDQACYRENSYRLCGKSPVDPNASAKLSFGTWQLEEISFSNQCFKGRPSPDWSKREEERVKEMKICRSVLGEAEGAKGDLMEKIKWTLSGS